MLSLTFTANLQAQNSIFLSSPPTTVAVGDLVTLTVNYTNAGTIDAYVLVRFKSPTGENLEQAFTLISPGSGVETLQVRAPTNAGPNYSCQAQLLEVGTWAGLAQDVVSNVTVSNINSITIVDAPSLITVNEIVNVEVNYNNAENGDVYVLVGLNDPMGNNIDQSFIQVTPGQSTVTLQVQAPATTGVGHHFQAQLLELGTWSGLAEDVFDNVTVVANTNNNIVSLVSWPSIFEIGENYSVTVAYDLSQNSIIYCQIFDREMPDGTGNWNKIGDGFVSVNAGIGNITINDIMINLDVGSSNHLEILLFQPIGGSWGDPIPIGNVSVNVPGNQNIMFGEPDQSDPSTNMRYYNRDIECNGNTYNGTVVGNGSGFDHVLSPITSVYRSNWWVNAQWKGPIKSHYGEDNDNGKQFWVEWQNLGKCSGGHAEFDIRVEKSNESEISTGIDAGFPSRLADITEPLAFTFTGHWDAGSSGRGHINMTTWVYNTLDIAPGSDASRCDIIIHAFDNSGDIRIKI